MKRKIFIVLMLLFYFKLTFTNMRVLSLTLGGDELLLGLGMKNSMVGVCGEIVDNPRYSNIVGKTFGEKRVNGNLEEIAFLHPDLVIVADWMSKDKIDHLEKMGINLLKYKTPNSFEELFSLIDSFNKKMEIGEKATEIKSDIKNRIENVKIRARNIKRKKRVLLYTSYGSTCGEGTLFDDISKIANFENIASKNGIAGNVKISKEKIVQFNPEIIIVPIYEESEKKLVINNFLNDKSLENIDAIKNKKIITIEDKHLMTSSQHMINSLEIIFNKIYSKI